VSELDNAFAAAEEKRRIRKQTELRESLGFSEFEFEEFKRLRETYTWSLYNVNEVLDDKVVGEYKTRLSTFTIFILAEIPTFMSGPSASGKTVLMDACLGCVLPQDGVLIEGGSDVAFLK
jgi:hypothetical protein